MNEWDEFDPEKEVRREYTQELLNGFERGCSGSPASAVVFLVFAIPMLIWVLVDHLMNHKR